MFKKITLRDWFILGVVFFALLHLVSCQYIPFIENDKDSVEATSELTKTIIESPNQLNTAVSSLPMS